LQDLANGSKTGANRGKFLHVFAHSRKTGACLGRTLQLLASGSKTGACLSRSPGNMGFLGAFAVASMCKTGQLMAFPVATHGIERKVLHDGRTSVQLLASFSKTGANRCNSWQVLA